MGRRAACQRDVGCQLGCAAPRAAGHRRTVRGRLVRQRHAQPDPARQRGWQQAAHPLLEPLWHRPARHRRSARGAHRRRGQRDRGLHAHLRWHRRGGDSARRALRQQTSSRSMFPASRGSRWSSTCPGPPAPAPATSRAWTNWPSRRRAISLGRPFTPVSKAQFRAFLAVVEVDSPKAKGTIVTFGDSITDGVGATAGANRRWPDILANRLQAAAVALGRGQFGHQRQSNPQPRHGWNCAGALR